jgi:hypothetical protein
VVVHGGGMLGVAEWAELPSRNGWEKQEQNGNIIPQ